MTENQVKAEARNKFNTDGYKYWFAPPRWLPRIQKWQREDILSVFDVIAVNQKEILLIQLTTLQHLSDRRKKIQAAGNFPNAYVWAWDKNKGRFKIEQIK